MSADRGTITATTVSGPAPSPARYDPSRAADAARNPYDMATSPQTTATASGVRAAWAANCSTTVAPGTGAVVSFRPSTSSRRSSADSTEI